MDTIVFKGIAVHLGTTFLMVSYVDMSELMKMFEERRPRIIPLTSIDKCSQEVVV